MKTNVLSLLKTNDENYRCADGNSFASTSLSTSQQITGLSRTKIIFQDFLGLKILPKIPGLSRRHGNPEFAALPPPLYSHSVWVLREHTVSAWTHKPGSNNSTHSSMEDGWREFFHAHCRVPTVLPKINCRTFPDPKSIFQDPVIVASNV